MPVVGEALDQYRHVLAFQNALYTASLMLVCDCNVEKALGKIVPDEAAEYRKIVGPPLRVISTALQGEKRALDKNLVRRTPPFSVVAVIRRLQEEKEERDVVPATQSFFLPCNGLSPAKGDEDRGIEVTVIWDGFPKGVIAMDRLEATVWVQFLILQNGPKKEQDRFQTWKIESREFRFVLKEENWIRE